MVGVPEKWGLPWPACRKWRPPSLFQAFSGNFQACPVTSVVFSHNELKTTEGKKDSFLTISHHRSLDSSRSSVFPSFPSSDLTTSPDNHSLLVLIAPPVIA